MLVVGVVVDIGGAVALSWYRDAISILYADYVEVVTLEVAVTCVCNLNEVRASDGELPSLPRDPLRRLRAERQVVNNGIE